MQTIPAFYFDPQQLSRIAKSKGEAFRSAQPFQHTFFDEFVPKEVFELLCREFPAPDAECWQLHGPGRTQWVRDKKIAKLGCSDETKFGPFTRHFMAQLNSGVFIAFLEELSGVKGIIPDPTYNHCGMHSTGPGGRLMMHTDVNRHPHGNKFHQFLNLIVYLNPGWREEWGGHLELWDEQRQPVQRIMPAENRAALFNAGTRSLHGHPHPLACPPDRRRNSLAVYYYLRERPASEDYTGMQKFVHWVPAIPEDFAFGKERTQKALATVAHVQGRAIAVPTALIPFDVPSEFVDASGSAPLWFLRPEDWRDQDAFADRHLRAMVANAGVTAAQFFARYRPVALLGVRGDGDLQRSGFVTCLLDQEGELHVVRGPQARDLFWVGFLDDVMASIIAP